MYLIMDRKSKIALVILVIAIGVSVVYTWYKTVWMEDFVIVDNGTME